MPRAAVLLALASALGAAVVVSSSGCGGAKPRTGTSRASAAPSYVARVNAVERDFARAVKPLSATVTATTTAGRARVTLGRFAAAVRALVDRLRLINAPPAVASLHARLVTELSRYERVLMRATRLVAAGGSTAFGRGERALMRATQTSAAGIDATIAAMNARLHG